MMRKNLKPIGLGVLGGLALCGIMAVTSALFAQNPARDIDERLAREKANETLWRIANQQLQQGQKATAVDLELIPGITGPGGEKYGAVLYSDGTVDAVVVMRPVKSP